MRKKFRRALKITGLSLFVIVCVLSLSVNEAPLPDVLPKNITVMADNENGMVVTGPGNSIYHYPGIADKGMMTRVIFDKRDRRFIILQVGLWLGRQLELWSPVPSGDRPYVRAYGFLSASGHLGSKLEVADNREHAPEHDSLELFLPSKRPTHPPWSRRTWWIC